MDQSNSSQNTKIDFKKIIIFWALVVFIAICAILIISFYLNEKVIVNQNSEPAKPNLSAVVDTCNFQTIAKKATEAKDSTLCLCLNNEQQKFRCQEDALNSAYFSQARVQFKMELCEMIKNDNGLKSSCQAVVTSGLDYLKKQDPEYLADVYSQNNEYDKAIEVLASSEKIKNDAKLMLALALNYAGKGLMDHSEKEFIPKAQNLVEKAIKLDPESAEAYRVQGYIYEVKPDLLKSIESYNKSLEKDPEYILSLEGRGHAYNLMGDLTKALEDFQKASELDQKKEFIGVFANLCRLQTSRDDLAQAGIKNCQVVLASPSTGAELKSETNQILADIYVREKKFNEALAYLENARTFSPQNVNLFVSFANLYNEKEDFSKAIEEAQKALKIDPLKTAAYRALSYAYLKTKNYSQAETAALKGLESIGKDSSLLVPNKPFFQRQLDYVLADVYAIKGDKVKETKYKEAGDKVMEIK